MMLRTTEARGRVRALVLGRRIRGGSGGRGLALGETEFAG